MFGNFRLTFGTILEILRKSSESGRKSSENHQKRRHQYVYIIKRILHLSSKIWILCSRVKNSISLVRCAHSWILFLPLEHKIHIFSPPYNILYKTFRAHIFFVFFSIMERIGKGSDLPKKKWGHRASSKNIRTVNTKVIRAGLFERRLTLTQG